MRALRVECPQQRLWGVATVSEEGVMKVQSEDALNSGAGGVEVNAASAGALVRLDIGEIELSLQEIVALRSGTAIDLKAEMPLRCFMRVGSATLALGELAIEDRGLVLRITEVMS
jgi:flagellar motor switch protein FliM